MSEMLAKFLVDIQCCLTNIHRSSLEERGIFQKRQGVFHNSLFNYGIVAAV